MPGDLEKTPFHTGVVNLSRKRLLIRLCEVNYWYRERQNELLRKLRLENETRNAATIVLISACPTKPTSGLDQWSVLFYSAPMPQALKQSAPPAHTEQKKPAPRRQNRAIARREAIIETTWQLISSRGFDATSVNTIISELGISKGSFYHHFPSKAAVLEAVTEMLTADVVRRVAADNANASALNRLNAFIQSGWQWHEEHTTVSADMANVLLRPENSALLAQLTTTEQNLCRPLLANIITQGMAEQSFDVSDAAIATEFVLPLLSDNLLRMISTVIRGELDAQGFLAQLDFLRQSLERVLGAPANTLLEPIPLAEAPQLVTDLFNHFET